VLKPRLGVACL